MHIYNAHDEVICGGVSGLRATFWSSAKDAHVTFMAPWDSTDDGEQSVFGAADMIRIARPAGFSLDANKA